MILLLTSFILFLTIRDVPRPVQGLSFRPPPQASPSKGAASEAGASTVPSIIYLYNLTYVSALSPVAAYEEVLFYASLAGLVNRDQPSLYTIYLPEHDLYWWDYMRTRPFMQAIQEVKVLPTLDAVLNTFGSFVKGAAIFDPNVPATSNVASTLAGVYDILPVAYRPEDPVSLYRRYVINNSNIRSSDNDSKTARILQERVELNLYGKFTEAPRTGSPKGDAYLWAIEALVHPDSGLNPALLAFFVDYYWTQVPNGSGAQGEASSYDLNTVINHDYFVANRAFFFDLNIWDDEAPNDEPQQPLGTDLRILEIMLQKYYNLTKGQEMITIGGFTPWKFKYVGYKHEGVETEWQYARLFSSYNALIDADACCVGAMTNAAFYQHYPLLERFLQNPAPTPQDLIAKGFLIEDNQEKTTVNKGARNEGHSSATFKVAADIGFFSFYVGDYDSSSWLYSQWYSKWDDASRGTVPLGWAINPNLAKRFPLPFEKMYTSLSINDRITTGDSGAGYINPTELFTPRTSGLPDGSAVWRDWCLPHYQQFDLTFTGFLLNGKAGKMTHQAQQFYTQFSWDGFTNHRTYSPEYPKVPSLELNTPVFEEYDIPGDNISQAAEIIIERYNITGQGSQFMIFRSILQSPSYHKEVVEAVKTKQPHLQVVDPLTLAYLARVYLKGDNNDRVTYINDTFPRQGIQSGDVLKNIVFKIRNNGFNTLRFRRNRQEQAFSSTGNTGNEAENPVDNKEGLVLTVSFYEATRYKTTLLTFTAYGEADKTVDVAPGETGELVAKNVVMPPLLNSNGVYYLEYGLVRGDNKNFKDLGNPRYVTGIKIGNNLGEIAARIEVGETGAVAPSM